MAKKNGGVMYPNVYNNTNPGEAPDTDGDRLYYSWDEVLAMHLSTDQAGLDETPNTKSGEILGGPAVGEADISGLRGR